MNPGPLETFTQEKSKQEYLQIKLLSLHTHWALFREQPQKMIDLRGNAFSLLPLSMILAVDFL